MAVPLVIAGVIEAAKEVIDRLVPDKNAAAQAKAALDSQEGAQRFQLALGQMNINLEEVKSGHWLGKWRGALGWICVGSIGYQLMLHPLLVGAVLLIDDKFPVDKLPKLEWQQLGKILMGMLGLGV